MSKTERKRLSDEIQEFLDGNRPRGEVFEEIDYWLPGIKTLEKLERNRITYLEGRVKALENLLSRKRERIADIRCKLNSLREDCVGCQEDQGPFVGKDVVLVGEWDIGKTLSRTRVSGTCSGEHGSFICVEGTWWHIDNIDYIEEGEEE